MCVFITGEGESQNVVGGFAVLLAGGAVQATVTSSSWRERERGANRFKRAGWKRAFRSMQSQAGASRGARGEGESLEQSVVGLRLQVTALRPRPFSLESLSKEHDVARIARSSALASSDSCE